ncbi:ROK family protein [Erwinia sp. CPCC 100877]|nr:ROK family protein [Erwinia sp. CPCC 100877]
MAILALDFGGTSIKYGLWEKETLIEPASIPLPPTWEATLQAIEKILITYWNENYVIKGIATSVPGAVSQKEDQIFGVTAIDYIHKRPFTKELSEWFHLPVTMENDANCAALSEIWLGNATDAQDILYFVFGTGVGGAIIHNKKVQSGKHQFGGEFGYMMLNEESSFSELASIVRATEFYNQRKNQEIDGKELFERATKGDELAKYLVTQLCRYSARGIYNLMISFDPDKIIIGGAISTNPTFIAKIKEEIDILRTRTGAQKVLPELLPSKFNNDANLIGAIYNFIY